ncbi:hypothetical protein BD289DRAFT_437254 [Coniella lustricola]|uniref:Uncharacterized protein n=1 Tax=Coniella lustricola TaxID=2025994 RepID=A0A2T3A455_9PEZI|nr:hypothetical protein BD289DRAFT_437254 [Coniella lustricola]
MLCPVRFGAVSPVEPGAFVRTTGQHDINFSLCKVCNSLTARIPQSIIGCFLDRGGFLRKFGCVVRNEGLGSKEISNHFITLKVRIIGRIGRRCFGFVPAPRPKERLLSSSCIDRSFALRFSSYSTSASQLTVWSSSIHGSTVCLEISMIHPCDTTFEAVIWQTH